MESFFAFFGKLLAGIMSRLYPMPSLDRIGPQEYPIKSSVPAPAAPLPPVVQTASSSRLPLFCTYIRDYEGGVGSLNYQLNNPGDCRPSPVGYLPRYQPVEIIDTDTDPRYLYHKGKFAKFPSYEVGWEYLEALVHGIATNHPQWTLLDFFSHYAPSGDKNDPNAYAKNVAKRLGVGVDSTLQSILG